MVRVVALLKQTRMNDAFRLPAEKVAAAFQVNPSEGLTAQQIEQARQKYGRNGTRLPEK